MIDIGLMSYYLGIKVKQKEDGIFISQQNYGEEMLKKFKIDSCKPIGTLVEFKMNLSELDEEEKMDATNFKSLVVSL